MSVTVRPFSKGTGWEVDIITVLPTGEKIRERRKCRVSSKSAARRWGLAREREIMLHGPQRSKSKKEVPKLADFVPQFLDEATASRLKPSSIAARETALRIHLIPLLGECKLDQITNRDIQRLKGQLSSKAPKTTNNILSVLNKLLKVAVDLGTLTEVPCAITLVRTTPHVPAFHDFDEFERLDVASRGVDPRAHLVVLLGGEAGLRCGEIMALQWDHIDLAQRFLWVKQSDWKGHVTPPKGGRPRCVPLTDRLAAALRVHRHLHGKRVLCRDDGRPLTQKIVRVFVQKAAREAGLANQGVHTLRHTFCSHLAMKGAPARAIQELAGHRSITTTQSYMHLSPNALDSAIRLLDKRPTTEHVERRVETSGLEARIQ